MINIGVQSMFNHPAYYGLTSWINQNELEKCLDKGATTQMNIVLLPEIEATHRLFTDENLNRLRSLGTVRINTDSTRPTTERVTELIAGADIAITSWGCPSMDESILSYAPDLKLIAHTAGTVKPIVSPHVVAKGIRVCSANDALAVGVAETALGLTIVSLKHIWQLARHTQFGEWDRDRERVRELFQVTIGIIGAGRSGMHLIRLLKNFDVKILVYDPYVEESQMKELAVEKVELEHLLKESDVVSIHAPSLPETDKLLNAHTLGMMKDDAILINTARGSLIDEDALIRELRKGRLWACLDVTDPEPPADNHPFRTLPNVTLIPHIAGATNNGLLRLGSYIVGELERFVEGRALRGEVDLSILHMKA